MWLTVTSVVSSFAPVAIAAPDGTEIKRNAKEVLADPSYQKQMTREGAPPRPKEARVRYRKRNAEGRPNAPSQGSTVSSTLLWLLIAVVGAAVLFWLSQELVRARRRKAGEEVRAGDNGDEEDVDNEGADPLDTMPATMRNARKLAGDGRFEDAIHLLLRGAFDYVAVLASLAIKPAMTSREVLRQAELDTGAHDAFGQLVMSVEVSLFGGMAVERFDFDRCADAFDHLHKQLNP